MTHRLVLLQRASLSARLTSLSIGELETDHGDLPGELAGLSREWGNIQTMRLPHHLSSSPDLIALLTPLRASLRSLELSTYVRKMPEALQALVSAGMLVPNPIPSMVVTYT